MSCFLEKYGEYQPDYYMKAIEKAKKKPSEELILVTKEFLARARVINIKEMLLTSCISGKKGNYNYFQFEWYPECDELKKSLLIRIRESTVTGNIEFSGDLWDNGYTSKELMTLDEAVELVKLYEQIGIKDESN